MRELVFVHGRAQEHKDASALKAEWISALQEGLAKSNLALPISADAIHFPYYGDTLYQLSEGESAGEAAEVIVRGTSTDANEQEFAQKVISEIATNRGVTQEQIRVIMGDEVVERGPLNWGWVQGILRAIDRHVPFGSGGSIALFTHDVYVYLNNMGIRDVIETGVRKAFASGVPTVAVSHSLGTIVAYSLLRREGKNNHWDVPFFVTLGSPLAISAIKSKLAPNKHPECVSKWFNAMDRRDVVALYPLDKNNFYINPAIENKTDVKNHTENRHGIGGYLDDAVVAKRIYDALIAT